MEAAWDVESLPATGGLRGDPVAADPKPYVSVSLGVLAVNQVGSGSGLISALGPKIPQLINFSYSDGLDFSSALVCESTVVSLTDFDPGLAHLPTLSEGGYECLGPELGALFDGDSWGTQQKGLLVENSSAPFSSSEVFNDSGTFPEVVVTVGEFFSGVVVLNGVTRRSASPPQNPISKGFAHVVDQEGLNSAGNSKHLCAQRHSMCAG